MKDRGKLAKFSGTSRFSRSRGTLGHRLSGEEMGMIKHADEVRNSQIRRGLLKAAPHTEHVQCGCGAPGCVFVREI
jgi:hypothetical protein